MHDYHTVHLFYLIIVYALIGMCNYIVRELGLSPQEREEYETELNATEVYKAKLKVMSKWFGIVFTSREN